MLKLVRYLGIIGLLWLCSSFIQTDWKLAKNKDNIKVYTRTPSGSSIKEFKAIITIKTTTAKLVKIIENANEYPDWQANVTHAKVLKKTGNSRYVYYYSELPMFISNRDGVTKMTKTTKDDGTVVFKMTNQPKYIAKKKDFIRIPKATGSWVLKPLKDGKVKVTYRFLADPGGKMPDWLINSFIVDGPFKTLQNLKKRAS